MPSQTNCVMRRLYHKEKLKIRKSYMKKNYIPMQTAVASVEMEGYFMVGSITATPIKVDTVLVEDYTEEFTGGPFTTDFDK